MKPMDCPGDLLARQRRGLTSLAEAAEAERHVAGCASCQFAKTLAEDFDTDGELRPGDDQAIARYAKLASATVQSSKSKAEPRKVRRVPRAVLLAAAALLLLAAGAAAATLLRGNDGAHSQNQAPPEPPKAESREEQPLPAKAEPEPAPPASPPEASAASATARQAVAPEAAQSETAQTLFAQANEARRRGDTSHAVALYQRLQKKYPGSDEGLLSRVTLGRLLLENGSPGAALAQFDAYLAVPAGKLRLEALAGRARALGALSRSAEERSAWERLLTEYPASVYSEKARKRIVELR